MAEQTRTAPAARLRAKSYSADALAAAKCSSSVPFACGEMPDAEGIPFRQKGDSCLTCYAITCYIFVYVPLVIVK